MELKRPKQLLQQLPGEQAGEVPEAVFAHIVEQIRTLDIVIDVLVTPGAPLLHEMKERGVDRPIHGTGRYRLAPLQIGAPSYDSRLGDRTVSLVTQLYGDQGMEMGSIETIISFDALMIKLTQAPWWNNYKAYLLDEGGNVLASTGYTLGLEDFYPGRVFGSQSELERATFEALSTKRSGTVTGPGNPPTEVSGFHRLEEAPWTMVVIAPGREVLASLIRFRLLYLAAGAVSIGVILLFLRRLLLGAAQRIKTVSAAAANLAKGQFGPPLEVKGRDEISELTVNFNRMSQQLQQRLALKEAIDLAREVQQGLLPDSGLCTDGLEVEGKSIYCDETGGDYFDIIQCRKRPERVTVVVGDVVGHGVGAALLMAGVRALLRCRLGLPGKLDEILSDINELLCEDTVESGSFVTLFLLEIDQAKQEIRWVRAGHDPALLYSPSKAEFVELKGKGIALGVVPGYQFESYGMSFANENTLIFLGSDGVWEAEDGQGNQYGRERLKKRIANCASIPIRELIEAIITDVETFRDGAPQHDDLTLAMVKLSYEKPGRS
jgi:sigma-B regulation protein RsbU (phosphoserine phosphatase)